ncbi:GNAT family N-acetyltransferase [Martelella sp. HB161492]|uniref:GNAT family N-acetyltransferase n=1 Tax=Martelella sp. HB161492 TaxID=2720726 RepID=UPI0015905DAB|nr:GNAT family N-acetyltransferase [Martelella sp. HB161492]
MADLLVNLYARRFEALSSARVAETVTVRRALPPESHFIIEWAEKNFSRYWASEVQVAMAQKPPGCFIATDAGRLVGFACYNATARGFFGPTGVDEASRGKGIGKVLLYRALRALKDDGYAYAIIGAAGPTEFYQKAVGAIVIPSDGEDIYRGLLRDKHQS